MNKDNNKNCGFIPKIDTFHF